MAVTTSRFSKATLDFIVKASRQRKPEWIEKHRAEYETAVRDPLLALAAHLKRALAVEATGYHFPQRGLGRLRRSSYSAGKYNALYRDYISYTVSRPSHSRFDHNPSLFFMIYPEDGEGDEVILAGGLYMPSSRQLRAIRESIACDATPFDRLFADRAFAARFPDGFSDERMASRPPRGFDPEHPRLDWLKRQGYFVWRSYRKREVYAPGFFALLADDGRQILRLNHLLEQAISARPGAVFRPVEKLSTRPGLSTRLEEVEAPRRKMDF